MMKISRMIAVSFALALFGLLANATHGWTVQNNGGGSGASCKNQGGESRCEEWCLMHNRTEASSLKCAAQCNKYWCNQGGGGASPAGNGKNGPPTVSTGKTTVPIYRGPERGTPAPVEPEQTILERRGGRR
jgi:hypothetical protein